MELVEGKTLLEAVREGPLSEKEVVRLGSQLARGLQAAHEHGVIHRDLKPGNLALTPDGLLKVLDFGLARLERLTLPEVGEKTASTDTAVGHVVGTPAYMAPEQLRGKGVDARTDVYGAGACLYELATGRRPFGGQSGVELTDAVLHEAPAAPRSVSGTVSPGLEAVILKCLDKDPELRYQTAKELLVDLERLQVRRARRAREPEPGVGGGGPAAAAAPGSWLAAAAVVVGRRRPASGSCDRRARPDHERPPLDGRMDGPAHRHAAGQPMARGSTSSASKDGQCRGVSRFRRPVGSRLRCRSRRPPYSQFDCTATFPGVGAAPDGLDAGTRPDAEGAGPLWTVPVPAGAPSPGREPRGLRGRALSPDEATLALVERGYSYPHRAARRHVDPRLTAAPLAAGRHRLVAGWQTPPFRGRRADRGASRGSGRCRSTGAAPEPLWPGERGRWTKDGRYFVFDRRSRSEARRDLYAVREPRFRWFSPVAARAPDLRPPELHATSGRAPTGQRLFALGDRRPGRAAAVRREARPLRDVPRRRLRLLRRRLSPTGNGWPGSATRMALCGGAAPTGRSACG